MCDVLDLGSQVARWHIGCRFIHLGVGQAARLPKGGANSIYTTFVCCFVLFCSSSFDWLSPYFAIQ